MKDVVIFEDGKLLRGQKAKLIKKGNKRVLIEFTDYDYKTDKDFTNTQWFKIFVPSWGNKKTSLRGNVRYYHKNSNLFYSEECQCESWKDSVIKEYNSEEALEYFNEIFGR